MKQKPNSQDLGISLHTLGLVGEDVKQAASSHSVRRLRL
jgi:hypothetical protein